MTTSIEIPERIGLGRAAARRWSRPGPPGKPRPAPLGSVAAAAQRFSAGLARAPQVRRQLAGPGEIRPGKMPEGMRPPRWWRPAAAADGGIGSTDERIRRSIVAATLPAGARASRGVPKTDSAPAYA